jgi:hypothetical protein
MENLWIIGPGEDKLSDTELLTLAFARMMDGVWPFEEVRWASLTDRLTRWQQSQEQYITILRENIAKAKTPGGLQRLKKNYEVASGKSLDDKEHPCHDEYTLKKEKLEAAQLNQENTSENPRDSETPSESSKSSFLT